MIYLQSDKQYFILIDGQGADFASGCIYESIQEVAKQFQEWAYTDGYEDPKLIGWSIIDCLENWGFTMKVYQVNDFVPAEDINYIITE